MAALGVDGDDIRPGLAEHGDVGGGVFQHQVHVEHLGALVPQGGHNLGAHAQVGHEVAVHDVDVEPLGRGGLGHLAAQGGEVRRQQGWGDVHGPHVLSKYICIWITVR